MYKSATDVKAGSGILQVHQNLRQLRLQHRPARLDSIGAAADATTLEAQVHEIQNQDCAGGKAEQTEDRGRIPKLGLREHLHVPVPMGTWSGHTCSPSGDEREHVFSALESIREEQTEQEPQERSRLDRRVTAGLKRPSSNQRQSRAAQAFAI
ncbi:hypothetical protein EYF80_015728 [Liparis tanakae]|uniref:Uncharacterized protein n=1 Tax=Liparis tanakae TaxID=230148 RepID=A0A4Z2I7Q1_9TELE|nr:hypothetical protein EYF80_015728 [Liparis tanakae]